MTRHAQATWDATFEEVVRSVLPNLPPDTPLLPDDDLRALGLDSQGLVEVLVRLETAYEALLPDDALDFESFATAAGLWATVAAIAPIASPTRGADAS
jgi:acyl carrier protein